MCKLILFIAFLAPGIIPLFMIVCPAKPPAIISSIGFLSAIEYPIAPPIIAGAICLPANTYVFLTAFAALLLNTLFLVFPNVSKNLFFAFVSPVLWVVFEELPAADVCVWLWLWLWLWDCDWLEPLPVLVVLLANISFALIYIGFWALSPFSPSFFLDPIFSNLLNPWSYIIILANPAPFDKLTSLSNWNISFKISSASLKNLKNANISINNPKFNPPGVNVTIPPGPPGPPEAFATLKTVPANIAYNNRWNGCTKTSPMNFLSQFLILCAFLSPTTSIAYATEIIGAIKM